ncbi:MAG: hypothetical protein E6J70_13980 [Deltaproteobacteria bacterium]|nr:MAG: hypothetical protein E6J70_13980 [Deltaproteobacteria bacterium]
MASATRRLPLACAPLLRLHTICPYYTMFPLDFPFRCLAKAEPGARRSSTTPRTPASRSRSSTAGFLVPACSTRSCSRSSGGRRSGTPSSWATTA